MMYQIEITIKRLRLTIQLELELHLMLQGYLCGAHEAVKSVMHEPQLRDNPIANLVHGLILHQLWYDGVNKGLNIRENSVNTLLEDIKIDSSENNSTSCGPTANSPPFPSRENSKKEKLTRLDSDHSIGNNKEFLKE